MAALRSVYENYVVQDACGGRDPLWLNWRNRMQHSVRVPPLDGALCL